MNQIPERFTWAESLVNPAADDRILEVGCGAGILASLLAARLDSGHLHAIDRSLPMVNKAVARNRQYIEAGKMTVSHGEFREIAHQQPFNKIVAFNVGFFQRESPVELAAIRRLLEPQGKLFVFYQAPHEIDAAYATPITANLARHSFSVETVLVEQLRPTSACCVIGML